MNKTIKKQFWITPEDDEILFIRSCIDEVSDKRL